MLYTLFGHDLLSIGYISSSDSWGGHRSCARAGDLSDWVASVSSAPLLTSGGEL